MRAQHLEFLLLEGNLAGVAELLESRQAEVGGELAELGEQGGVFFQDFVPYCLFFRCVEPPNDPKLSDGGGWRAGCMVAKRRRPEAASVTAGAVRCSA